VITVDVSSFFSSGGGGGIRAYYEAKARWLAELGIECHFVVPGAHRSIERWGGGWLHRIAGPPLPGGYRAFGDLGELRRAIRGVNPDLVELATHYVLPLLVASACPRAAVVGFYHSDFPTAYVRRRTERMPAPVGRAAIAAAWWLVQHHHRSYRATLTGSQAVAASLVAARVPNVRWVGLGVDPALCAAPLEPARHGRIGYLGRLHADKEIELLLATAASIERTAGVRITIAGDGPAAPLVRAAARQGLVDVLGPLAHSEVPEFLRSIDALIVPGRYETFSLATAEALACGTPVIAARRGGSGELVTRSGGGLTFAPGNAAGLAAAVCRVLAMPPAERAALRTRGRHYIASLYTWPRVMARIRAVHDSAVRDARCSS
jgi:glycosyltransferase involved in cell wall biosynthesis